MRIASIDLYAVGRTKTKLVLASTRNEMRRFMRRLCSMLATCDFPTNDVFAIQSAVKESLTNAIVHGNELARSKRVRVTVDLGLEECRIRIRDEGNGFDPSQFSDPAATMSRNGRGLRLIRHCMHVVRYNEKGNCVTLIRKRSTAS
jgi:serine/threonine-protein kinase RsbW